LVLGEEAAAMGVDLRKEGRLKSGLFGGEPWSDNMRGEMEEKLGLEPFDSYGLAEIIGPGVAIECPYHDGLHIAEDHFYPEIINPQTGERLGYGQVGELVLTTLTKEALPLVRYRTRDLTSLRIETCACGRTMTRMSKVLGRSDDMLCVRGVNVFPSQVEHVLLQFDELEPQYMIYVDRGHDHLDRLEVWVEASQSLWRRGTSSLDKTSGDIRQTMRDTLYVSTTVKIVEPGAIQRSTGKAVRVMDRRAL
jgi:phenylacetate-CoA ligase